MLPFLSAKKAVASVQGSVIKRKPDEGSESEAKLDEAMPFHSAAEDLMNAIHSKDSQAVAMALKAALNIHESLDQDEPMEEMSE